MLSRQFYTFSNSVPTCPVGHIQVTPGGPHNTTVPNELVLTKTVDVLNYWHSWSSHVAQPYQKVVKVSQLCCALLQPYCPPSHPPAFPRTQGHSNPNLFLDSRLLQGIKTNENKLAMNVRRVLKHSLQETMAKAL